MRKYKKDIIIDLTKSLIEAHEELLVIIKNRDYAKAYNLLEVCQHAAYSIGTSIEESESNSDEIIPELEAFCDDLYLIGSNLTNDEYDLDPVFESIASRFDIIESYIKEKIKITYEIVFLPYNASMWDSMESVWLAASNDPSCSCYVIPIPYYEKTASGTELKYEGASFPKYVPVVHYNDYSIPDRKPDIIYIHNPFDQYNRVTSVHPAFYSSELKKHTNMLVYIPYFITGRFVPDTFLNLPSYKNIDKIVIQSHHQLSFYRRYIPSEKLVALGSPKVDKVISMNKGCVEIPEEWKSKAENKRVIFYNTSLSGLLKYREKALDKMEYVFSVFARREKEVLLWRPHPLSKATLRSMLPAFYRRYCELEKKFINSNIGIYDDTPDVSSSIALSDAYIGEDGSSIVHLFGVTGKPIFLLNMELDNGYIRKLNNLVGCMDACIADNYLWFINCHYNALCKIDINTGIAEIVDRIPSELLEGERLYHDVIKIDDKLYFAPNRAKRMAEYDLRTNTFTVVPFKDADTSMTSQFTRMVRYKDNLFLIPSYYSAVIRYNIRDRTFKYYPNIVRTVNEYADINARDGAAFIGAVCVEENVILMASAKTNVVLEFNMDTEELVTYRVGKEENNYCRMAYDGNDYWLIPFESNTIVRWNRKTGHTVEYSQYPDGFIGGKYAFLDIVYCGEFMLVFPKKANMIVKIDVNTGKMSEFKLALPYKEGERKEPFYSWPNNYYFVKKLDAVHILALTAYDCSLVIINVETNEFTLKKCVIEKRRPVVRFGSYGDNFPYACIEGVDSMIDDFLDEIDNNKVYDSSRQLSLYSSIVDNMDETCGIRIHKNIMEQIAGNTDR